MSADDWRARSERRNAVRSRRRANAILVLVALLVLVAAFAAFAVPMLLTP